MTDVAPGEAQHPALALVNTRYLRHQHTVDVIAGPSAATRWLRVLAPVPRLDERGTAALRTLRDCVGDLLRCYLRAERPPAMTVGALNAVLLRAPRVPVLRWIQAAAPERQVRQLGDDRVAAALGVVAADVVSLLTGPDARRLAACGAPDCARLLLRTHGRRQWCSNRCGDRVRAARHYARHRDAS